MEDLGIIPDHIHRITRKDLMESNQDLIESAAHILGSLPVRALSAVVKAKRARKVSISVTTKNITRLDTLLNGRPQSTLDVKDGRTTVTLPLRSAGKQVLELRGFDGAYLVSARRLKLW